MQFWDAQDKQFQKGWIIGSNEMDELERAITDYMNSNYSEQIKIFTDKELAKKERERIERLRIQRERREKEERQKKEDLMVSGSWDLTVQQLV